MAEDSLLTDKILAFVGKMDEPVLSRVEDGCIQRFAEAVGTTNPLNNDLAYAKNSKFGALVAPIGCKGWPLVPGKPASTAIPDLLAAGAPQMLMDGGVTYEYYGVIKSGDLLTSFSKVEDIKEKAMKSGSRMLLVSMSQTFTNQDGKLVLKESRNFIFR